MIDTMRIRPSAAAGASLLAATLVARRGVPAWERSAYRAINDLPDDLAPAAWPPMQFGSLTAPFVLAGLWYWKTRRSEPPTSIIAAGWAAWITAKGVKQLVGRGRPHDHDSHTNLRLGTRIDGSLGFVSGHAAVAMATAGIVHRHLSPGWAASAYGLAGVVGICRIYVGAHYPVDVLGGLALGVLISEGVIAGMRRLGTQAPPAELHPPGGAV